MGAVRQAILPVGNLYIFSALTWMLVRMLSYQYQYRYQIIGWVLLRMSSYKPVLHNWHWPHSQLSILNPEMVLFRKILGGASYFLT